MIYYYITDKTKNSNTNHVQKINKKKSIPNESQKPLLLSSNDVTQKSHVANRFESKNHIEITKYAAPLNPKANFRADMEILITVFI